VLGELYKPKGLALETAQQVLEVENPYACNVACGCLNKCAYCYVPKVTKSKAFRLPKETPMKLVKEQLERMPDHPKGVFLSFLTDPFHSKVKDSTEELISFLLDEGIRVATLSKLDASTFYVRHGMTIVSLDNQFYSRFEPNAASPQFRIETLKLCKGKWKEFTWVSIEPYPPSAIYKQNLEMLLEQLTFVDLIIFGKWNYDKRANTEEARREYADDIFVLSDFCKSNGIRLHVKSNTLKFAYGVSA